MKRKQAMAHNFGPTINFLSIEDTNRIRTGGYARPITLNYGVSLYGGHDDSYGVINGCREYRTQKFRQIFEMLTGDDIDNGKDIDIYQRGVLDNRAFGRPVWSVFGYRVVLEFFDTNALADFTGKIEDGAILDQCRRMLIKHLSGRYQVREINEHLLNIQAL